MRCTEISALPEDVAVVRHHFRWWNVRRRHDLRGDFSGSGECHPHLLRVRWPGAPGGLDRGCERQLFRRGQLIRSARCDFEHDTVGEAFAPCGSAPLPSSTRPAYEIAAVAALGERVQDRSGPAGGQFESRSEVMAATVGSSTRSRAARPMVRIRLPPSSRGATVGCMERLQRGAQWVRDLCSWCGCSEPRISFVN